MYGIPTPDPGIPYPDSVRAAARETGRIPASGGVGGLADDALRAGDTAYTVGLRNLNAQAEEDQFNRRQKLKNRIATLNTVGQSAGLGYAVGDKSGHGGIGALFGAGLGLLSSLGGK